MNRTELLAKGLNRMEGSYYRGRQSLGARADEAASERLLGQPQDFQKRLLEKAAKVTPEQLSRFPDVLTVTKEDEDLETVSADLCAVAEQALEAYNAMRAVEGRKLAEDIGNRLTYIENYTSQVEQRSPETVTEYRAKLTARMEEVLQCTTIDPQRILQEAAIYADKVAVDEETVRLRSHVAQLRTMLESDEPMGRKMDFLIQEVNRESNTIGSKCCDVAIAQVVVGLKAEVEKMREQVQNVE